MKPATAGGPYRVPRQNDGWRALTLAAAMHAGLFFFLWVGVHWQNTQPVAVEAEVWDMTTQTAAPPPAPAPEPTPEPEPEPAPPPPRPVAPPVEAPPTPKEPDIALERKKAKEKAELEKQIEDKKAKLKQEKEKADDVKKLAEQKKLDDKKKEAELKKLEDKKLAEEKAKTDKLAKTKTEADKKKLDQAREAEMRRITGAAGAGTTGTAAKATAPRLDSGYVAAITAKIKSNIAYSGGDAAGNPRAEFKIEQLPTGEIISVRKIKSSGIPAYDLAVENAIAKSSPLPKKKDGTVERDVVAGFNLKDLP